MGVQSIQLVRLRGYNKFYGYTENTLGLCRGILIKKKKKESKEREKIKNRSWNGSIGTEPKTYEPSGKWFPSWNSKTITLGFLLFFFFSSGSFLKANGGQRERLGLQTLLTRFRFFINNPRWGNTPSIELLDTAKWSVCTDRTSIRINRFEQRHNWDTLRETSTPCKNSPPAFTKSNQNTI